MMESGEKGWRMIRVVESGGKQRKIVEGIGNGGKVGRDGGCWKEVESDGEW